MIYGCAVAIVIAALNAGLLYKSSQELPEASAGVRVPVVILSIEIEREADGRWLAEVPSLAGVMCYGADRDEAVARVQALALRVIAERLEHREAPAEFLNVTFQAA